MRPWPHLDSPAPRPASRWWLFLCVLHGMASMLVWWAGEPTAQALTWRAGEGWERPWTWWTTAWVHIHTPHLITNQLAIGALAALAWVVRPDRLTAIAWALAWPLATMGLSLWPQIGYCVGLSGVLHAGVAVMGLLLLLQHFEHTSQVLWGGGLMLGLLVKLGWEQGWHLPVVWDDAANLSLVRAVHLTGATSGWMWVVVTLLAHALVQHALRRLRHQSRLGV